MSDYEYDESYNESGDAYGSDEEQGPSIGERARGIQGFMRSFGPQTAIVGQDVRAAQRRIHAEFQRLTPARQAAPQVRRKAGVSFEFFITGKSKRRRR
jgi:hypothetical protein